MLLTILKMTIVDCGLRTITAVRATRRKLPSFKMMIAQVSIQFEIIAREIAADTSET
jgi:hypothetical protein